MSEQNETTEACGCPTQGRPDGQGWHLDTCLARVIELDSRARWMQFMEQTQQMEEDNGA